jgi:uncharacterized membrane protein
MDFDPETALQYAASIARPRRVGSGEDEAVADELAERLTRFGWQVERQPFQFSTAPNIILTVQILVGLTLVLSIVLLRDRVVVTAAAVLLLGSIVFFGPTNRFAQASALDEHRVLGRLGRRHTTANLIASQPLPADPSLPQLYLVAHYDSKSQRLPLAVRIALFTLIAMASILLAVLTILQMAPGVSWLLGLAALSAGVPLLFLDAGNHSPGAIDNASSVGLVLHLAEVLAQRPAWRAKLRVTLLLPSAEEMNVMGSAAFVGRYIRQLRIQADRGGLYVLNFDGIGIDGDLYYVGSAPRRIPQSEPGLLRYLQRACDDLKLPLKRFRLVGALFDHIPFAQRGFDAVSLIAIGRASRSVHTSADSVDKLHARGFDQAGRVALAVIEKLTTDSTAAYG